MGWVSKAGIAFLLCGQLLGQSQPTSDCADLDHDTSQINCYLARVAQLPQVDSALEIAYQMLTKAVYVAQRYDDHAILGKVLRQKTHHFRKTSELDSMAYYSQLAIDVFEADTLWQGSAEAHLDLGHAHQMQGDMQSALGLFIRAAMLNDRIKKDSLNDRVYINIAAIHANLGDTASEKKYLNLAKNTADLYQHQRNQIIVRMGLASIARRKEFFHRAHDLLNEAESISEHFHDPVLKAYLLMNRAHNLADQGHALQARNSFEAATKANGLPPFDKLRLTYFYLRFLTESGANQLAQAVGAEALVEADQLGADDLRLDIHEILMENAEKAGDFEKAYYHAQRYKIYNDSLFDSETQAKIQKLTLKFEKEQSEKENQQLKADQTARELALTQAQNRARTRLLVALIFLASLIGGLIAFFYYKRETDTQTQLLDQTNLANALQINQLQREQESLRLKSMLKGEEVERGRIARDLHDGLGGLLSTLKVSLQSLLEKSALKSENYQQILHLTDKASQELRQIAHNLVPEGLNKFGLLSAIEDAVSEINYNTKLKAEFQNINVQEKNITSDKIQIYRIVQELLNNIIKHAEATSFLVQVMLRSDDLILIVEDDGKGFSHSKKNNGMGLENIENRLAYLQGDMAIDSSKDIGTTTTITIPQSYD